MSRQKPRHYQLIGRNGERAVFLAVLAVFQNFGFGRAAAIDLNRQTRGAVPSDSTVWRWISHVRGTTLLTREWREYLNPAARKPRADTVAR